MKKQRLNEQRFTDSEILEPVYKSGDYESIRTFDMGNRHTFQAYSDT